MVVVAGAMFLLVPISRSQGLTRTRDQSVLLLTIDTLRADALGAYGGTAVTPNLDALAAEGVRFTFMHGHAVLTLPSHVSILTGRYPFDHRVRDNSGFRLPSSVPTLATHLKSLGYETAAFVGAYPVGSRFGLARGFDVYDEPPSGSHAPEGFLIPERRADEVLRPAEEWIRSRRGRWFAWVHLYDPHAPYRPPAPFDARYAADPYLGEVAYTDAALTSILTTVRAQTARPTLIVMTADHGEGRGEHGERTHGLFAYEGTLRVPLIISQQNAPKSPRHLVSDATVGHVDLLPTILDAIEAAPPGNLPGRSLLPLTTSRPVHDWPERPMYFEALSAWLNRGWAPLVGILSGKDKYIQLPRAELYDLSVDRAEHTNLVDRSADRARTLAALLQPFTRMGLAGSDRSTESSEGQQALRALGYVSAKPSSKARYTDADDPKALVDVDEMITRGLEMYSEHRLVESADLYKAALKRRPDMSLGYLHLAFLQWDMGDGPSAIETLRMAERNGTADPSVRLWEGTYLALSGRPEQAIPILQSAAASDDTDALNALGIAYATSGRSADARTTFERALRLDRVNTMALENLGALELTRKDFGAALSWFDKAITLQPDSSKAYAGRGVAQFNSGKRTEALADWQRAIELDPHNFEALFNLGTILVESGERNRGAAYLEQFVQRAPPAQYAADITRIREQLRRLK